MLIETAFVKLDIKDQELTNIFIGILNDSDEFSIIGEKSQQKPDLILFELGRDYEKDLDHIQAFLENNQSTEFFLISKYSDQDILIKSLRIGVKEFFPTPLKTDMVDEALDRFRDRREKKKSKTKKQSQVFSVVGSKGGVGTTTIAVNLAVALAMKQEKPSVALLDMNDVFGEISIFLDLSPKHHWGNITNNIERLDTLFLSNILSEHDTGIHILPSPRFLNEQSPTPATMEILIDTIKMNFDYVVIDMGQSTSDTAFKVFQISDLLLIVTIQSLPCLSNTNLLIKSFSDYGLIELKNIHIALNRYIKNGSVSKNNAEEGIGKKISWVIPNDYPTTMAAINTGKPLCQIAPKSKIVKSFNEYAGSFFPEEPKKGKKWTWFSARS